MRPAAIIVRCFRRPPCPGTLRTPLAIKGRAVWCRAQHAWVQRCRLQCNRGCSAFNRLVTCQIVGPGLSNAEPSCGAYLATRAQSKKLKRATSRLSELASQWLPIHARRVSLITRADIDTAAKGTP